MEPNTRLSSAVFKLTPTRTRCDLIIIANDKEEKIASGLLNPFLAHLKTAQDQIAKGGYSILLEPETDAAWFTKATLERFVRFVSTPEILERVYTIETEILQIEEAVSTLSSNDISQSIEEDYKDKPMRGCEANKSGCMANEEKAIVLYKPDSPLPEVNGSHLQEGNSKVQLLKVLETRKTVLQKEQEMAFARAVAASFSIHHMPSLVSFAECFGALRLMEACSRFMNLWKSKQETGEWLDIKASEALSTQSDFSLMVAASGVLSDTNSKHDGSNFELGSEENAQSSSILSADNPAPNNFQGQYPHIVFPQWPIHAPGAPPVFQAYPMQGMPYYQTYETGGPFFQPPPHHPMEHSPSDVGHHSVQTLQSLDGRDKNTRSNKKQRGMVVIQNINYVTSKENENESGSELNTDSDSEIDTEDDNCEAGDHDTIHGNSKKSLESKGNHLIGSDDGNWQAFQNCLLRGSEENAHASNEDMFAVEKNAAIKRRENILSDGQLALIARDRGETQDTRGFNDETDIQHLKIFSRSTHEDFVIGSQQSQTAFRNSLDPLAMDSLESATSKMDGKFVHGMADETLIVPFRSVSLDQAERTVIDVDSEIPSSYKNLDSEGNKSKEYYEPDDLSMMPERGTENRPVVYDPALDYEMQVCAEGSHGKGVTTVTEVKGGLKKADNDRRSKVASGSLYKKRTGGSLMKGKPSKMSPPEEARARAESLRSYKADLQKMKKEKDEAEAKRLEALKLDRQKRIAARGGPTSTSGKPTILSPQTKQFPAKFSPVNKSKFSDAEPGLSSPLQRAKIRNSLASRVPLKSSKGSKLGVGSHMSGNRLTRSSSSLSDRRRESHGGTPNSKTSASQIRRLSEPKRAVSKRQLPEGPERNKISAAIINLDKSKAATLPELKIKTSKSHISTSDCSTAHQVDAIADDNMVVEKTVVMLEFEKPSLSNPQASEGELEMRCGDREKGKKSDVISELSPIHAPQIQNQFYSKEVHLRSESMSRVDETVQVHAHYGKFLKLDKNPATADKALAKESSSKGLRRLLKFGKKNHTSSLGNQSFDSDCTGVDGSERSDNARNTASKTEVFTIKNLISQDETSAAGKASHKISHHFSLFSPFRSKTNEKKRGAS